MRMDKQKYTRLNITLPTELLNEFEKYCERQGMMLSSRIAILIKKELDIVPKLLHYRVILVDEDRNRESKNIENRIDFVQKANLSKTKDSDWDTEVLIIPIKSYKENLGTTIFQDTDEKEVYYGKRVKIEKILKTLEN